MLATARAAFARYSFWSALTERPLLAARPFRDPHHTASRLALVGGGTPPRPGEVSLAHACTLLLDEVSEPLGR